MCYVSSQTIALGRSAPARETGLGERLARMHATLTNASLRLSFSPLTRSLAVPK